MKAELQDASLGRGPADSHDYSPGRLGNAWILAI